MPLFSQFLRRLVVVPSQPTISKLTNVPVVDTLDPNTLLRNNSLVGTDLSSFLSDLESSGKNESFMFGLDLGMRSCGNIDTPANTAYIFVAVVEDQVLSKSQGLKLEGGKDSLISVNKETVCVYSALRNSTSASPADATIDKLTSCFPSSAQVQLEGGELRRMDDLTIGDVVKTGPNSFSPVFMFTHRDADIAVADFISVTTASGHVLALSSGHYLPVDGGLKAASSIAIGDVLMLENGDGSAITSIETKAGTGLYNPQTADGSIVVDGIVASTFTTAVDPVVGSALLAVPSALFCSAPRVFVYAAELISTAADFASVRYLVSSILPAGNVH
jgi:Hint module